MSLFTYDAVAHKIDQSMWQWIDITAQTNPRAAKLLAVSAFLETLAKDILYSPGCIIETVLVSSKFVTNILLGRTNGSLRHWMWIDAKTMWKHSVKCAVCLPFSSLYAVVDSIRILYSMIVFAKKTGMLQVTHSRLNDFIYTLLTTREISSQDTVYLPFIKKESSVKLAPSCVGVGDFVHGAYERFKKDVFCSKTNEEASSLHFIDTEEAREQLKKEVLLKCSKIKEAHEQGYLNERLKVVQNVMIPSSAEDKIFEEQNAAWVLFQKEVVQAKPEQLDSLKFNSNVELLLVNAAVEAFKASCSEAPSLEKTEKIRKECSELIHFIQELLISDEIIEKNTSHLPLWDSSHIDKRDFVRVSYERFKRKVLCSTSKEEIDHLHLVETAEARQLLKNEVLKKYSIIIEANRESLKKAHELWNAKKSAAAEVEKQFILFQKKVTEAEPDQLDSLSFLYQ